MGKILEEVTGLRQKSSGHYKYLCCHCLKSGKGHTWSCGTQGHTHMKVSHKLHFISPAKSRTKWKRLLYDIGWMDYFIKYPDYRTDRFKILLNTINKK